MDINMDATAPPSTLQIFHNNFGEHQAQLTALLVNGEPWFRGKDAATALGYKNLQQAIRNNVDEEDRRSFENLGVLPGSTLTNPNEGACTYLSESGLYSLIMSSKLPHAKAFKRWVLKEVLPTIRRTGSYSVQASLEEEGGDASTTAEASPPPAIDAKHWEDRRARLGALAAAHALASAAGLPITDAHNRAIRNAVDDTILPADPLRIDAAEFLCRKGHSPAEIRRLASEMGRALKTAWVYRHGDDEAPFDTGIAQYRVREDALFLEEVYSRFRTRPLFARVCGAHQEARGAMAHNVSTALSTARGFIPQQRGRARSG
jgi:prophage antirepressor-like protein